VNSCRTGPIRPSPAVATSANRFGMGTLTGPVGSFEVGQHEDVEQLGAGSRAEGG
jgi:hypothetical protein